jgi:hypothetical protein
MDSRTTKALNKLSVMKGKATDVLELELTNLSRKIEEDVINLADDKSYFMTIHAELKHRRETKDEQPEPQAVDKQQVAQSMHNTLTNKLIAMEAEQARLVLEVEIAKEAAREAESRLAILAKSIKQP